MLRSEGWVLGWPAALLLLTLACGSKTSSAPADAGRDTAVTSSPDASGSDRPVGSSDSRPDTATGGTDASQACTGGKLGQACAGGGSCCQGLMCLAVGGAQATCCTPVGGSCTQQSDCCDNGLSCVDGKCCGTSLLSCSATSCCPGYYCNPGNYCSPSPDAGSHS